MWEDDHHGCTAGSFLEENSGCFQPAISTSSHTQTHTHTRTAHNSQIWSSVHIHEYLLQMQICTHTLYRCKAKHTHPNISTSFIVQLQPCNTADLNANLTHSLQNELRFNTFNTPSHVKLIRAQYFCKPSNPPSCTSVMHLFISGKHDLDWVLKPQHKSSWEVGRFWTTICTLW